MPHPSNQQVRRVAGVDEAAIAEWARWFDELSPQEQALIDAVAARELAEHGPPAPEKRPRPRAAMARKLPK